MPTLLHIKASPRGDDSRTIRLANAFLGEYLATHPHDRVSTVDVFHDDLPAMDERFVEGRYRILHGLPHDGDEAERWRRIEEIAGRFCSADKVLITCPMWNFSIPHRMKLYLDIIIQPTLTFGYERETGYVGLAGDRPVMVLATRGGWYTPESGEGHMDFQTPYLRFILSFMGITSVEFLVAEPLDRGTPAEANEVLKQAIARARDAATRF